jgi:hypothetical protein
MRHSLKKNVDLWMDKNKGLYFLFEGATKLLLLKEKGKKKQRTEKHV